MTNDFNPQQGSGLIFMANALMSFSPAQRGFLSIPSRSARRISPQRRGARPSVCHGGVCPLRGPLAGSSKPALGTTQLGRCRPSTCRESVFAVFPMHLRSEHTRLFFFLFYSPKMICSVEMQLKKPSRRNPESSLCLCPRCLSQAGCTQQSRVTGAGWGGGSFSSPIKGHF